MYATTRSKKRGWICRMSEWEGGEGERKEGDRKRERGVLGGGGEEGKHGDGEGCLVEESGVVNPVR